MFHNSFLEQKVQNDKKVEWSSHLGKPVMKLR